jgi:hypothetical protein
LGAVLSAGLSRSHRGNPAASLRTEKLYSLPVLMSGMASLNLLDSEVKIMAQHYKETLEGLQKLYKLTPKPVVFFLAGSLPFPALLHIGQLGKFGMIARLPNNILHKLAEYSLLHLPDSSKSWFIHIKNICYQYALPHPLTLLHNPPEKETFKQTVKLKVQEFWQSKLRQKASSLDSLLYFKPEFMTLNKPHPLWTTCGSSSYETNKACIQAKFLSGRFRTDKLLSNFSKENSKFCQLHPDDPVVGDLVHHLAICPALDERRKLLFEYWNAITANSPPAREIIQIILSSPLSKFMQFILDCSCLPEVISARQKHGDDILNILFKATRTYCYSLYRERLKKLDRWC